MWHGGARKHNDNNKKSEAGVSRWCSRSNWALMERLLLDP